VCSVFNMQCAVFSTCSVQCFQLHEKHMAASTVEKNNSNNIDLATQISTN